MKFMKHYSHPKGLNRNEYVYYSPKYKEHLYIYYLDVDEQEEFYIYEPINVNELRRSFMQKNDIKNIEDNMTDKWHSFFFDVMNSTYRKKRKRKKFFYTLAKLLRIECGDRAYMVCRPKTTQLLYDLIDGNVVFDIFRIGRFMITANSKREDRFYDKFQKTVVKEKNENCISITPSIDVNLLVNSFGYDSFDEFKQHEKNNICYALFLKELHKVIIDKSQKWCMENHINYLINIGKTQIFFPYPDIGFLEERDRDLYYCPFFNTLIYDKGYDKFHDYSYYITAYSNECWDSNDELIKVPVFASPKSILIETGLSVIKTYDKQYMDYYLDDKIYYDHFWNEYGIRNKEEQLLIYNCIYKYKLIARNWFIDRGARMYFILW